MTNRPALRAAAAGALLLPVALLATGCSAFDAVAHHQKSLSFADRAALEEGWDGEQNWIPADAEKIEGTASTTASDTVLLLRSAQELDPAACAETSRRSAPNYVVSGAPDVYKIDTVFACGSWTVARTDDGWLGWTPNSPDEAAESPRS